MRLMWLAFLWSGLTLAATAGTTTAASSQTDALEEPLILTFVEKLPPGTYEGPPPTFYPYKFSVSGTDLESYTSEARPTVTLTGTGGWGYFGGQEIVAFLNPRDPAGIYLLTITLPDGRHAEASIDFTDGVLPDPTLAEPLGLHFVERLEPGSVPGPPANFIPYKFLITGVDLDGVALSVYTTLSSQGFNRSSPQEIVVFASPRDPAGDYTVTLTLPDGGTLEASFTHTP